MVAQPSPPDPDLLARMAIRSVLDQYFSSVDRQDWDGVGACFASDATATYNTGQLVHLTGRDAIVERVQIVKRASATNHTMSNTHIVVSGDTASAVTLGTAHLVIGPMTSGRVVIRGLRYEDDFAQRDGIWQIVRRSHNPLWQYEAQAVPLGY